MHTLKVVESTSNSFGDIFLMLFTFLDV